MYKVAYLIVYALYLPENSRFYDLPDLIFLNVGVITLNNDFLLSISLTDLRLSILCF